MGGVDVAGFGGTERFQVLRRLGEGGMGIVYEAVDREKNTRVALKTLKHPNASTLARLKREFRALSDLSHPNLVSLGELLESQGQWFFTMELACGVDFLTYVRCKKGHDQGSPLDLALTDTLPVTGLANGYDEDRLRASLCQLAEGLHALHVAGKVHRDVKPSNVLISDEGRLTVVDFGLVTEMDPASSFSDATIVGTAAYMAPEQAASSPVGPPADWYSLGVMLYEALLGVPPISGSFLQVLMEKQRHVPPSPRTLDDSVPRDLDSLCADLLALDPAKRPSGASILQRLGRRASHAHPAEIISSVTSATPLVGRQKELEALSLMFEEVREGKAITAILEGESGVGKSSLVRRFTDTASVDPNVVVLAGRCYEREAMLYKAMDGVVDALARFMTRLPDAEAAALVPRRAALLPQVFPVLGRVAALAKAPAVSAVDPQEIRTRLFAALREMFGRLAERHRVVVVIDDLQWADADSLTLLSEILRPPEAPAMLLLATRRSAEGESGSWRVMAEDALPGDVRRIQVGRLSSADAQSLATMLLERSGVDDAALSSAIARESEGHPLFIHELIRHDSAKGSRGASPVRLEEALWERISRLSPEAQRLLEVISVAGAPLEQEIAAMASGLAPHQLSVHAGVLRSEHLARTAGPHGRDTIFTYHDRVRNAVLLHLEPTKRRACHHELARTLESTERGDPEVLAVHYRAAGDQEKAAKYAVVAADRATGALAFEQAARLYQLAIKLGRYPRSEERPLLVKLGQALMNAGRGKEAAEAYLAAADGASVGEALQLQQKAALQLLITGHVDEGIAAIRTVLAAEGLSYPATPRKALMSLLVDRARLRIRGLRFRRRDESEITAHQLARIDACWSAGIGLALCDPVRGTAFQGKGLLLALDAGEARRVSRALAMEAAFLASQGVRNQARAELYLSRAEEVAREVDDPYSVALACGLRAFACYFWGQWTLALEYCEKSEQLFQERCVGVHWEIANARIWIARLLYFSGRMRELSQRAPIYLLACRDRGNLHGETTFRAGVAPFLALAADDPGSGHEEARWAVENWSRQGFHLQHHYALYSRAQLYAYQGNPEKALEILTDEWPALKRSLLLRVQHVRVTMYEVRARAFLGAACANSPAKKHLIAQAEKDARSLHRENAPWATALATLVQAGIATSLGNQERAAEFFADAERGLEAVHMSLHAACARWQRGLLLGGDDGRALVDSATLWMLGEAIKNPERMTALLAPGVS